MKVKNLTRYLIKIGVIFTVILIMAGGTYLYMNDLSETITDETSKLKTETGRIDTQSKVLQDQLRDANKAMESYNNFDSSRDGNKQNFHRDFARTLLAGLRDQDAISDLQLNMESFAKASIIYERPTVALYKSKIAIQFTADTDIDVFNLIRDISQSFPGNVEIISYSIQRMHDIDDSTLLAIGEGKARGTLVKGEVVFEWQGIQENQDYKKPPGQNLPNRNKLKINPNNDG